MTGHSCRIAFFDAKPYDRDSFNSVNEREFHYDIRYFKGHLTPDSVPLTHGTDVACIFVNDTANREVIRRLKENGVKLLALRCAGFNNVDLKAAEEAGLPVVRVPQYSPYAVAEHAVALMLSLNRKIHRAYWRTRDGNFSLHGLMGFDMKDYYGLRFACHFLCSFYLLAGSDIDVCMYGRIICCFGSTTIIVTPKFTRRRNDGSGLCASRF